jgi:DNA-nicking Smr family endonuclease
MAKKDTFKFKKEDLKFWHSQTDDLTNKTKKKQDYSFEEDDDDTIIELKPGKKELLDFRKIFREEITTLPDLNTEENAAGIDRKTHQKFKAGKMPIEGKLDMHGMTQNEAFPALLDFINRSFHSEKRCLIVVTGKGFMSKNRGILKQSLPIWINNEDIRPKILSFCQARPTDGGSGAFYIFLKRKK